MKNSFAEDCKNIRKYFGLTQTELSEQTGVPRITIARLETDAHAPSSLTLENIYSFAYDNGLEINENHALKLCSIQAKIFESCANNQIDEIDFINRYMKSIYTKSMDDGTYFIDYEDQITISQNIKSISRVKEKQILNNSILHYLGYFYRYYCCYFKVKSITAWKEMPINYLIDNYEVLHGLDIAKACETAKNSILVSRDAK